MLIIGIILGALAVASFGSCIYYVIKEDGFLLPLTCFLCFSILIAASILTINASLNTSEQRTIKCTEIQQIDTLYRNDAIVGYEITLIK